MGKRYLLLIIAALLIMPGAFAAITVNPNAPAADLTQSSSTVSFNCNATEDDTNYEISNISLYIDAVKNQTQSGASLSLDVSNVPTGSHNWYCEAVNNASVSASSATRSFTIASSSLTFSGTIPAISFPEDTALSNNITLSDYFSYSSTPTYSVTGNTSVIPSISSGVVGFSAAGNWSGSETLTITATLGALTASSNAFTVTVTAVNDAPYYTTIPNQNMTKNTNHTINLNDYFHDVEGTALTYNVSTAPSHMNYTISGSTVTLAPETNWAGTATISFTASDGNATTTSNTVTLNVSGNATGNRAPRVSCSPTFDKVSAVAGESKVFRLSAISDPDGDTTAIVWKVDGTNVDGETEESYTFSKEDAKTYTVTAVVSDGSLDATCSWEVSVSAAAESNFSGAVDVGSIIEEQTEEISRCGDGKIQEGETCSNCPDDVKCSAMETCQGGVCVPKTGLKTVLLIIGIALVVILGGGFIAYKLSMRRKVGTRVRDGRNLSRVEKERPSTDISDLYDKEEHGGPDIPSPEENPLKRYISEMRKNGFSDEEIAQALKSKGWSELMIRHALKK